MLFWHNHSTVRTNSAKNLHKAYSWDICYTANLPKSGVVKSISVFEVYNALDLPLITDVCFQRKNKNAVSSRDVTGGSWVVPGSKGTGLGM